MSSYSYPIDFSWTTEETLKVVNLFQQIEVGYETGVKQSDLQKAYQEFKHVVPSKAEEKTLFKEFEQVSTYKPWTIIKQLKSSDKNDILKP